MMQYSLNRTAQQKRFNTQPCEEGAYSDSEITIPDNDQPQSNAKAQKKSKKVQNEVQNQAQGQGDMHNFKGIYFDQDTEKYTCPRTGAHFRFDQLWRTLENIRRERGDPECQQLSVSVKSSQRTKVNAAQGSTSARVIAQFKRKQSSNMSENFVEDTIDERELTHEMSAKNFQATNNNQNLQSVHSTKVNGRNLKDSKERLHNQLHQQIGSESINKVSTIKKGAPKMITQSQNKSNGLKVLQQSSNVVIPATVKKSNTRMITTQGAFNPGSSSTVAMPRFDNPPLTTQNDDDNMSQNNYPNNYQDQMPEHSSSKKQKSNVMILKRNLKQSKPIGRNKSLQQLVQFQSQPTNDNQILNSQGVTQQTYQKELVDSIAENVHDDTQEYRNKQGQPPVYATTKATGASAVGGSQMVSRNTKFLAGSQSLQQFQVGSGSQSQIVQQPGQIRSKQPIPQTTVTQTNASKYLQTNQQNHNHGTKQQQTEQLISRPTKILNLAPAPSSNQFQQFDRQRYIQASPNKGGQNLKFDLPPNNNHKNNTTAGHKTNNATNSQNQTDFNPLKTVDLSKNPQHKDLLQRLSILQNKSNTSDSNNNVNHRDHSNLKNNNMVRSHSDLNLKQDNEAEQYHHHQQQQLDNEISQFNNGSRNKTNYNIAPEKFSNTQIIKTNAMKQHTSGDIRKVQGFNAGNLSKKTIQQTSSSFQKKMQPATKPLQQQHISSVSTKQFQFQDAVNSSDLTEPIIQKKKAVSTKKQTTTFIKPEPENLLAGVSVGGQGGQQFVINSNQQLKPNSRNQNQRQLFAKTVVMSSSQNKSNLLTEKSATTLPALVATTTMNNNNNNGRKTTLQNNNNTGNSGGSQTLKSSQNQFDPQRTAILSKNGANGRQLEASPKPKTTAVLSSTLRLSQQSRASDRLSQNNSTIKKTLTSNNVMIGPQGNISGLGKVPTGQNNNQTRQIGNIVPYSKSVKTLFAGQQQQQQVQTTTLTTSIDKQVTKKSSGIIGSKAIGANVGGFNTSNNTNNQGNSQNNINDYAKGTKRYV